MSAPPLVRGNRRVIIEGVQYRVRFEHDGVYFLPRGKKTWRRLAWPTALIDAEEVKFGSTPMDERRLEEERDADERSARAERERATGIAELDWRLYGCSVCLVAPGHPCITSGLSGQHTRVPLDKQPLPDPDQQHGAAEQHVFDDENPFG